MMMNHKTNQSKPAGSIKTEWEMRTYDVWGNAQDGYDINDVYSRGTVKIHAPQTIHNVGTPCEFKSAYPSQRQIKRAFGVSCRIDIDGDDTEIRVERKRDGYPFGELRLISHSSLSPVTKITDGKAQ